MATRANDPEQSMSLTINLHKRAGLTQSSLYFPDAGLMLGCSQRQVNRELNSQGGVTR